MSSAVSKSRIESFSDIVFGLALSIGALSLIGRPVSDAEAVTADLVVFGYSFLSSTTEPPDLSESACDRFRVFPRVCVAVVRDLACIRHRIPDTHRPGALLDPAPYHRFRLGTGRMDPAETEAPRLWYGRRGNPELS